MAAYCRVYDSRHLQADCQEPGSAPEPYARQSSRGYLFLVPATNRPLCMHKKLALQRVRGVSTTGFAGFEDFNNFLYFDLCQLLSARLNSLSYRIVSYRIVS